MVKQKLRILIIASISSLCQWSGMFPSLASADEPIDPLSVLRQNISFLDKVELNATSTTSNNSNKGILEGKSKVRETTPTIIRTLLYRRDLKRTFFSEIEQSEDRKGVIHWFEQNWIDHDGELLAVQDNLNEKLVQFPSKTNNLLVWLSAKRIADTPEIESIRKAIDGLNDGGIVIGYLGYFPLSEYLTETAKIEVTPDGTRQKVTSTSELGHLELWLDPKLGYLPTALRLIKQKSDRRDKDTKIDKIQMNGDEKIWPNGGIKRIIWYADDIEVGESKGVYYFRKIVLKRTVESVAGPTVDSITDAQVTSINFSPEFTDRDFSPRLTIPVGTPVGIVGADQLPYEWNGTAVVPSSKVTTIAPSGIPQSTDGRSYAWLIAINGLIAVVLGAVFMFRRNSERK